VGWISGAVCFYAAFWKLVPGRVLGARVFYSAKILSLIFAPVFDWIDL